MIRGEQFRHDLDRLTHAFAIRSRRVHGEDFHPVLHGVLAGGQQLAFGRAFAALLSIDLDDAKPADRDRRHVRQMAQVGIGIFASSP